MLEGNPNRQCRGRGPISANRWWGAQAGRMVLNLTIFLHRLVHLAPTKRHAAGPPCESHRSDRHHCLAQLRGACRPARARYRGCRAWLRPRSTAVIRIRRCEPTGILRRRRYEVELLDQDSGAVIWRKVTPAPVTLIDRHIGVAEAWALLHSADDHWERNVTDWVSLPRSER